MASENWVQAEKLPERFLTWADEAAALRREIHSNPELGFETPKTCALIERALRSY